MNHYQNNKRTFWMSKAIEGLFAFIVTVIAAILGTLLGFQMRPILVNLEIIEPTPQSEERSKPVQEHPKERTSLHTINPSPWKTCEPNDTDSN